MFECEHVQKLTHRLHTGEEPFWARLREVVRERGVMPDSSWLARSHEEDDHFEFGVLVTKDRQVIQFGFLYTDESGANGTLTEWNDLTESWATSPYSPEVSAALSLIG